METTLSLRVDKEIKKRFAQSLRVGRPATMTDVLEHLMESYADAVDRDKRQPEFPLVITSKHSPPATDSR